VDTPAQDDASAVTENLVRTLFGRSRHRRQLRNVIWPEHLPENPAAIATTAGWHSCSARCNWDIDALKTEHGSCLTFSDAQPPSTSRKQSPKHWRSLAFAPADHLLIFIRCAGFDSYVTVWAHSPEAAEHEFMRLRQRYARKRRRNVRTSNFCIITSSMSGLETRTITLRPQIRTESDLALHYPSGFLDWSNSYIGQLKSRASGLSILRGEPGLGKTTYVRYLTWRLRSTHRFYFLPLAVAPLLSSPAGVEFWLDQHKEHERMRKVVVLEDAESLLLERGPDNQESVSTLLNLSDGLLGDALRLHVICTTNSSVEKLDPALLRTGRLIAVRSFSRLSPDEVQRLANSEGLQLDATRDYSLAEVYGREVEGCATRRSLGFVSEC
jgi:hypothetical protein